ncbi:hypothetical protein AAFF_G00180550 [Aldrovandia affinis]|uniref:Uncharacterized protein n=1 Tax=Aldrovandia affinis TaxID=143900 RepID=A0AAD7SYD7_9TELE|nr:hypothetical protein AAFF_G00180550 [Aldrovandia affinis]
MPVPSRGLLAGNGPGAIRDRLRLPATLTLQHGVSSGDRCLSAGAPVPHRTDRASLTTVHPLKPGEKLGLTAPPPPRPLRHNQG